MYMKHMADGKWLLHAAPEDWHKKGQKPDQMIGYSISTAEMIFLMLGFAYVICDVDYRFCPATPMSLRFMHFHNKQECVASYGVIDSRNNVTKPVNAGLLGQT